MAATGLNKAAVRLGTADQTTTGAVLMAPLGTTLPTIEGMLPAGVTLDPAFEPAGYISEDGCSMGLDVSVESIREWNKGIVRNALDSFDGTLEFTLIQTDETTFELLLGDDYVTAAAADTTHGSRVKAGFGAHMAPERSFVVKLKDGDARVLILVPVGQVTAYDTVEMTATGAIGWHVTVTAMDDGTGNSIYVMLDDGVVSA